MTALALILVSICMLATDGLGADVQDQSSASFATRESRYRLGMGDSLELKFPLTPEFDQTITVQPDGYVTLRNLPDARLEGLTLPEVRTLLARQYAVLLRDPQINITLKEFSRPVVFVTGQVKVPGKQDWRQNVTLLEAVASAGGVNEDAKHSQVLLLRRVSNDWVEVKQLNLKALLQGRNLNEDPQLRPGDVIVVPRSTLAKIRRYIPSSSIGMFANPGQF